MIIVVIVNRRPTRPSQVAGLQRSLDARHSVLGSGPPPRPSWGQAGQKNLPGKNAGPGWGQAGGLAGARLGPGWGQAGGPASDARRQPGACTSHRQRRRLQASFHALHSRGPGKIVMVGRLRHFWIPYHKDQKCLSLPDSPLLQFFPEPLEAHAAQSSDPGIRLLRAGPECEEGRAGGSCDASRRQLPPTMDLSACSTAQPLLLMQRMHDTHKQPRENDVRPRACTAHGVWR